MNKAVELFVAHNGILRTGQALALGISARTLYAMRDSGLIRQISRGVYQLTDKEDLGNPDLVLVALRIPKAVICLVSALHYYGITSQIPGQVNIALPQSSEKPRLEFPPLDIIWLSKESYAAGITEQQVDNVLVKIYSREKTITDCFKFRGKVGIDVALEALREYVKKPDRQLDQLLTYARINRVEGLLSRYLEALI